MDCFSEVDKLLRHYNDLVQSLDHMDRRIPQLVARAGPHGISAQDIEDSIKAAGSQDETINIIFELDELTRARADTREEIARIEAVFAEIEKDHDCMFYVPILRAWYIDMIPKESIAKTIGYSSRVSIYTIKARAIRKFAVKLYGIKALKGI